MTKDKEAAEFVESCMGDMQATWTDTIRKSCHPPYGWSFHEIVYKRRMGKTKNRRSSSKYSDGLIAGRNFLREHRIPCIAGNMMIVTI